jgi:hypothetical protein
MIMTGTFVGNLDLKPEQKEIAKRQSELATLEAELARRELDLVTLQSELHSFERYYHQVIGMRFAEIDYLENQIAEYVQVVDFAEDVKSAGNLKKIYRALAKQIHPDLIADKDEKERRLKLMMAVNQAYERGDEDRLRDIMHKWEMRAELIRTAQKIAQSNLQIKAIDKEMAAIQQTELNQLRVQVIETQSSGQDLLQSMALELDEQINHFQNRLKELKIQIGL